MYKQHLLNSIEKEIHICRRLYTKIPVDQMNFRPGQGVRSTLELLQYLSIAGTLMPTYWLKESDTDFGSFYVARTGASKSMAAEQFLTAMDEQLVKLKDLFNPITEEDLIQKEITYPWSGAKAALGEGIISTSVKWVAAYKLQLFLFIKLSGDQSLATADAWALTEIS